MRLRGKIHLIIDPPLGAEAIETACNFIVMPIRDANEQILRFVSDAGTGISCVIRAKDCTCKKCIKSWEAARGQ